MIASNCILKRKIQKRTSRVIKEHPSIGKDIEGFVKSKKVGADAWRRTGVLTFDGVITRAKKVTYKNIFRKNMVARLVMVLSYSCVSFEVNEEFQREDTKA